MTARIHLLARSPGGVPKRAVDIVHIGPDGLEGDWQRNRKYHGGPVRAVCLFPLEHIEALQAEGHPIAPGDVGENVVTSGLSWSDVAPGVRLQIGDACVLEITSFTAPCRTIRHAFSDGDSGRIAQDRHPGWSRVYARVVQPGTVRTGDPITLHPEQGA